MNSSTSRYLLLKTRFAPSVAALCCVAGASALACLPLQDLDATAAGPVIDMASGGGATLGGTGGSPPQTGSSGSGAANSASGAAGVNAGGAAFSAGGAEAAGTGGANAQGGSSSGGAAGSTQALSDLPIEMNDSPVPGSVGVSAEASWEVNGVMEPSFQVDTPTATYFVVKKLGMVVSMVDKLGSAGHDWISFSDAFRPHRGLPNLGSCCEADASAILATSLDTDTMTPGHIRLNSSGGGWILVWDFYRTHTTLTVNRAPQLFSFGYRGTPGGMLDAADRFVSSDGQSYPALSTALDPTLSGPAQWAYVSDDSELHSLFLVQHGQDTLRDHYGVDKSDTSVVLFGAANTLAAPLRFSFGLIDSIENSAVAARVNYVIDATPAR